jgi:hypothetical protein
MSPAKDAIDWNGAGAGAGAGQAGLVGDTADIALAGVIECHQMLLTWNVLIAVSLNVLKLY